MPFVVDGHNLLKAVQKTFETFQNTSEVHMCKLIEELMSRTRDHADIIFDGTGPPDKSDYEKFHFVDVKFSGSAIEADDIIEDLIEQNTAPKKLNVISNDRRLIAAAKKRKSSPIDCIAFWTSLISELDKQPKIHEPLEKQTGISQDDTDKWLKEFGL